LVLQTQAQQSVHSKSIDPIGCRPNVKSKFIQVIRLFGLHVLSYLSHLLSPLIQFRSYGLANCDLSCLGFTVPSASVVDLPDQRAHPGVISERIWLIATEARNFLFLPSFSLANFASWSRAGTIYPFHGQTRIPRPDSN
jgi:hypothetical protein